MQRVQAKELCYLQKQEEHNFQAGVEKVLRVLRQAPAA